MEAKLEEIEGIVVISLPVEHIDAGNYEDVQEALGGRLTGLSKAILDLAGIKFIDSSGIGVILYCIRELENSGGKLRICGINDTIRSAFQLVRIDRLAQLHDARFEAIAAFNT